MKYLTILILLFSTSKTTAQDLLSTPEGTLKIIPILHGSLVLQWQDKNILIDPYGGAGLYQLYPPHLIVITDIHGDHHNPETLDALPMENTELIAPEAVKDLMSAELAEKTTVLSNGTSTNWHDITIKAIPMYNLPETADSRHPKGRGNGYILTMGGENIYISGDTEDIPEMRSLENIDVAFVCMNLPYTMDVDQAADAVIEFQPKIVYPFHYRGGGGKFSDLEKFKSLVENSGKPIEVRLRNWYEN